MEFYRTLLPARDSEIYDTILTGLRGRVEFIPIPLTPSADINQIMRAVLADHPEIPWASGKWKGKPGMTDMLVPSYVLTEEETSFFCKSLPSNPEIRGLSQLRFLRNIFDAMLEMVVYDPAASHSQNAYGALIEKRAVCRGIAKGFQLLAGAAGIHAVCVEGTLDGEARHIWNIILTTDGNYHVDVSMGYPQFEFLYTEKGLQYNKYCAFCVSDETLRKTHHWDPAAIPLKCRKDAAVQDWKEIT